MFNSVFKSFVCKASFYIYKMCFADDLKHKFNFGLALVCTCKVLRHYYVCLHSKVYFQTHPLPPYRFPIIVLQKELLPTCRALGSM